VVSASSSVKFSIDWCCFYYFVRNSLVALLEALCARIFSFRFVYIGFCLWFLFLIHSHSLQCTSLSLSSTQQPHGIVQISSVCWGCGAYLPETWNLPVPRCSSRKSMCACLSCARWFHRSCFAVLNARSARRDLTITSSTVVHSGRLATLFTSQVAVSSWNRYKVRIASCIAELLQMLGLAFLELFVQLSTLLILSRHTLFNCKRHKHMKFFYTHVKN